MQDDNIRRDKALKFQEYLKKTVRKEVPWTFYGIELTKEDLEVLADECILRVNRSSFTDK